MTGYDGWMDGTISSICWLGRRPLGLWPVSSLAPDAWQARAKETNPAISCGHYPYCTTVLAPVVS